MWFLFHEYISGGGSGGDDQDEDDDVRDHWAKRPKRLRTKEPRDRWSQERRHGTKEPRAQKGHPLLMRTGGSFNASLRFEVETINRCVFAPGHLEHHKIIAIHIGREALFD